MHNFIFSFSTRCVAVACGFLAAGWLEMQHPLTATAMIVLGILDPAWIDYLKLNEQKSKNKKTKKNSKK